MCDVARRKKHFNPEKEERHLKKKEKKTLEKELKETEKMRKRKHTRPSQRALCKHPPKKNTSGAKSRAMRF